MWDRDGRRALVHVSWIGHSAPPGRRKLVNVSFTSAPVVDWDFVAATPAGRAALAIREQVVRVQGPGGPLAIRREAMPELGGSATAYWSPDGTFGPLCGD